MKIRLMVFVICLLLLGTKTEGASYMRRLFAPALASAVSVSMVKADGDHDRYTIPAARIMESFKKCGVGGLSPELCGYENGGHSRCDATTLDGSIGLEFRDDYSVKRSMQKSGVSELKAAGYGVDSILKSIRSHVCALDDLGLDIGKEEGLRALNRNEFENGYPFGLYHSIYSLSKIAAEKRPATMLKILAEGQAAEDYRRSDCRNIGELDKEQSRVNSTFLRCLSKSVLVNTKHENYLPEGSTLTKRDLYRCENKVYSELGLKPSRRARKFAAEMQQRYSAK